MMRIVVVGTGGHGREVLAAAECLARVGGPLGTIVGFLDDDPARVGTKVAGLPVLGTTLSGWDGIDGALLGIGYPEVKAKLVPRLDGRPMAWPSVIHPRASVEARVTIGRGAVIQAGAALTVDIEVGAFACVNVGATVNHDCRLGDLATVSPGAHLGGNVSLGEGAFVGIGATVVQGVRVGRWSVIGAGAVVLEDVPPNAVVVGVPARVLKLRPEGWQVEGVGDR